MPDFNARVKVLFEGESAKLVAAEFKKLSTSVSRDVGDMRKQLASAGADLKSFKALFGRSAAGYFVFDAITKSIEAADQRLNLFTETQRDAVKGFKEMALAARSLDAAGVAAGLGQALGSLWASSGGPWGSNIAKSKVEELSDALERQKNLARILAKEGYDVARMSLEQLEAVFDRASKGTANLRLTLFGDSASLRQGATDLVNEFNKVLATAGGNLKAPQIANLKPLVQSQLDLFAKYGLNVPADLQKVADAYGIVTSAAERAGEKVSAEAEARAKAAAALYKSMKARVDDAMRTAGQQMREQLESSLLKPGGMDELMARVQEAQALLEASMTSEERRNAAIAKANEFRRQGLYTEEQLRKVLLANADTLTFIADESERAAKDWKEFKKLAAENFLREAQQALAGFFLAIENGGGNALKSFGNAMLDLIKKVIAEWLAEWVALQVKMLAAALRRIAVEAAAQRAANAVGGKSGGGTGGGTGWLAMVGQLFNRGGSASNVVQGSSGQTAVSTQGTSGWGASSSSAWGQYAGAIAMAAGYFMSVAAAKKALRDKRVVSQLTVSDVGVVSAYGSLSKETADKIREWLTGLREVFGRELGRMDQWNVQKLGSGKFRALVDGISIGVFKNWEAAAAKAFVQAFESSAAYAKLSGALRGVAEKALSDVKGGADPAIIASRIAEVKALMDQASGLSETMVAIGKIVDGIDAIKRHLIDLGVSTAEASRISSQGGVQSFIAMRRQITGEQESPKEQLARRKREAAMFNAQLAIWRVEIVARIAYLKGQLSAAGFEVTLNKNVLDGRLRFLRASGRLFIDELSMKERYLQGRAQLTEAETKLMEAELANLEIILKSLSGLDINVGGLKPLGGRRRGGAGASSDDSALWDALLGPQSALSNEKQLQIALDRFRSLGNMDDKRGFASTLLGEAQGYYGNTAPYAQIYDEVIKAIGGAKFLTGGTGEGDARKEATHQLLNLASAAAKVTSALLGGRRHRTSPGTASGALTAGKTSTSTMLAQALTGLTGGDATYGSTERTALGGSTQIVSAIQRSDQRNVSALQTLAETMVTIQQVQQRRRRARSTAPGTYTPPPPPPPSGTTTVVSSGGGFYSGGGGGFERVA